MKKWNECVLRRALERGILLSNFAGLTKMCEATVKEVHILSRSSFFSLHTRLSLSFFLDFFFLVTSKHDELKTSCCFSKIYYIEFTIIV